MKIDPKGGTAPVRHLVKEKTSSVLASSTFLLFKTYLINFHDNFLLADITAKINIFCFKSFKSIAFAPESKLTPLTLADSSLVLQASWSNKLY